MGILTQPIKWHGGKHYLAPKIVALMPTRCKNPNAPASDDPGWLHYVEPYAGGLSVLLANDPEGISEVVNDLNSRLARFWKVLASKEPFEKFLRAVHGVPFSEQWWAESETVIEDFEAPDHRRAVAFFVRCRQSLAGRMDSFAGITKNRTRRGMNEQVSAWLNAVEGLPAVHARLKRVLILNRDALDVIRQQDGPRTLFYLDPPYLHETRATTGEYGEHEMTVEQHTGLLNLCKTLKGKVMLSGYRSDLYDRKLGTLHWNRHDFTLPNQAAGGKTKRRMVECVWTNY